MGDQRVYDVVIVETSEDGFRIRSDRPLAGAPKEAKLRVNRYGDFAIEIKWVRGTEAGGVFLGGPPELP